MNKRSREAFEKSEDDPTATTSLSISINSERKTSSIFLPSFSSENKELKNQIIFNDDVLYEILSFHHNFKFIVTSCALVSKQWFNVVVERCKFPFMEECAFDCKVFGSMSSLTSLEISCCVGNEDAQYISQLKQLKQLNANYNGIGCEGVKGFGNLKNMTNLSIGNNSIGDEGVKYFIEMKQLTCLTINRNSITEIGAEYISQMTQLKNLNIHGNDLGILGAKYIGEMIHLTFLNISFNRIGDEGAKYISGLTNLTHLFIQGNQIQASGAQSISELKKLSTLNINENPIGSGMKYLSNMQQLTFLSLRRSMIEEIQLISKLDNLTELDISGNRIGEQGVKHIRQLKQLTRLQMFQCDIGEQDVECLYELKHLKFYF